ncbi:hypothetical protein ACFWP7_05425 [Streptomyces sp. NPDC058470]|uniref:hypothetical protein n=1 Tax=Streptomyces sp. NPDC058470 TaxID=3346515 RepID=UPI0036462A42
MRTSLLDNRCPADFELLSHFCLSHPRSPFNHRLILQRTQPAVRHMPIGNTLTEIRAGVAPVHRELGVEEVLFAPEKVGGVALEPDEPDEPDEIESLRTKAGAMRAGRL